MQTMINAKCVKYTCVKKKWSQNDYNLFNWLTFKLVLLLQMNCHNSTIQLPKYVNK